MADVFIIHHPYRANPRWRFEVHMPLVPLTQSIEYAEALSHEEFLAYVDEDGGDDIAIGYCLAGHVGNLGRPCIQRSPDGDYMEECGTFM